jgi:hypothetical protein
LRALCVGTIAAIIGKAMPIGAPSMLAIARAALTGAASDKPATASADAPNSFANPLIWLIGVALRNSRALLKTGLGARIGHGFIARFARAKLNALGPMSRGEKILLGVFAPLVMIAPCLNRLGLIAWLSKSIATHIGGLGLGWVGACALLLLAYLYAHCMLASTTAHIPAMFVAFHGAGLAPGAPPSRAGAGRSGPGQRLPQPGAEELERRLRLRCLLRAERDAALGQVGLELGADGQHLLGPTLGRDLEDARPVGVEPHLDDDRSGEVLRRVLRPEQEGGPEHDQLVQRDPGRRSSGSTVAGSNGRSLTTVSARPPWMRRARATTLARFEARSGVSKKQAWRGCASTGSRPMLPIAVCWLLGGTESFSSMLVEPLASCTRCSISSPVSGLARRGGCVALAAFSVGGRCAGCGGLQRPKRSASTPWRSPRSLTVSWFLPSLSITVRTMHAPARMTSARCGCRPTMPRRASASRPRYSSICRSSSARSSTVPWTMSGS